jgi:hypothetical protein
MCRKSINKKKLRFNNTCKDYAMVEKR